MYSLFPAIPHNIKCEKNNILCFVESEQRARWDSLDDEESSDDTQGHQSTYNSNNNHVLMMLMGLNLFVWLICISNLWYDHAIFRCLSFSLPLLAEK